MAKKVIDLGFAWDRWVTKLEPLARCLFVMGLYVMADDEGRLVYDEAEIRSQCLPRDDVILEQIQELIKQIKEVKLIEVYKVKEVE